MPFTLRYRGASPPRGSIKIGALTVTGIFMGDDRYWPDYTVFTASPGSYSVSGQSVNLVQGRRIDAGTAGIYALTGQDINLTTGKSIDANTAGAYALTGQDVNFSKVSTLDATTAGAYALTGQDAGLTASHNALDANTAGAYTLTGQDVSFLTSIFFTADVGTYTYSGVAALLQLDSTLLSGDMQSGTDRLSFSGDMAPGNELLSYT